MVSPLMAAREETAQTLSLAYTRPKPPDLLELGELSLRAAVFDHAIDVFGRLPLPAATAHGRWCSEQPCEVVGTYGLRSGRVRDVVATVWATALEAGPDTDRPAAAHLRMGGGRWWTETMTRAWLTPGAPNRPDDLPRGVAVPAKRTRQLAERAIATFLELRDERGCDEPHAHQQAVVSVAAREAARELHRHTVTLATDQGVPWTEAMSHALFDLQAPDRPDDLPWSLAVPPRRVRRLAADAVGLFLEYRDQHDHPEPQARLAAVAEVLDGEAAREVLERPDEPAPQRDLATVPGRWCSYLENGGDRGTVLGHGHLIGVAADGAMLIRPEGAATDQPPVRQHRSVVDLQPLRRESETPEQFQARLHGYTASSGQHRLNVEADATGPDVQLKETPARQVGDVVMALIPDPGPGRWDAGEQGVITTVLGPDEKYAFAVTFAGQNELPEFLGGGPAPRTYYFRANDVSGPLAPEHARVGLVVPVAEPWRDAHDDDLGLA